MTENVDFLPHMARGLFVGAVTGSVITTLPVVLSVNYPDRLADIAFHALALGLIVFVCAFLVWLFGLVIVGLPSWLVLHRLGYRNVVAAVVLGFVATFFVTLAWRSNFFALPPPVSAMGSTHEWYAVSEGLVEVDYKLTRLGWKFAFEGAAELGALGVVVAIAVWTAAYHPRFWHKRVQNISGE